MFFFKFNLASYKIILLYFVLVLERMHEKTPTTNFPYIFSQNKLVEKYLSSELTTIVCVLF